MNVIRIGVLLLFSVLGVAFSDEGTNTLPTKITIGKEIYEDVVWGTVTPSTVSIRHKSGIARIPLENLPPELQQRFGYDPTKAAANRAQELAAQEQTRAAEAKRHAQRQEQSPDIKKLKGSVEYLDACNGFKDLKFGTDISECQGMKFDFAEKFGITHYLRTDDYYKIGEATVVGIFYSFYKGKFKCVEISEGNTSRRLLAVLQQAYGAGTPNGKGQIIWLGQKVSAVYYNDGPSNFRFSMSSKPIEEQIKADQEAREKEAAKGL